MSNTKKYEQQIILHIITDPDVYLHRTDVIKLELFSFYPEVFNTIKALADAGKHIAIDTIYEKIPENDQISELCDSPDFSIPVDFLIEELEEARKKRILLGCLNKASGNDSSDEIIKALIEAVNQVQLSSRTELLDGYSAAVNALKKFDSVNPIELSTGFKYLDKLMGGFQRTDLVIIAAGTGQGKTSLALQFAKTLIKAEKTVLFISLEMSDAQLMLRMMCSEADIPISSARENVELLQKAGSIFHKKPLFLADLSNNSLHHIVGLIRSTYLRHKVDVVFVDYLQLVGDKSIKQREQEVGHIDRTFKNLSKELNIITVLLSQLSRPKPGQSQYPTISRLRDSGQIEEAADVVMLIYRPEEYKISEHNGQSLIGKAEVIIAKGRNYGTGSFICRFKKESAAITDELVEN